MNMREESRTGWKPAFALLCIVAGTRLVSLGLYPLMDTSEARYAEIARKMAAKGDWITLWFDPGIPFWGKPPLSFWLDAFSFKLFGVGEFPARLPHWLTAMFVLWLLWHWLEREYDRRLAAVSCVLLATTALYFVVAGAVLTDMSLALGTVLVMIGFWRGMHPGARPSSSPVVMLFGGFVIGLLAKGPVILVLAGVPIAAWALWQRKIALAWRQFPWLTGILLTLVIAVPWYIAAEMKTPGFIDYFIIGEHWKRFTVSGWTGDRYGTAHDYTRGMIWLFLVQSCFPWTLLLPIAALWERFGSRKTVLAEPVDPALRSYLLLWGLWPAVFFSFAGNVLWTYVLPGLPALAALCGIWLLRLPTRRMTAYLAIGSIGFMVLFSAFVAYFDAHAVMKAKTAKFLVTRYETLRGPGEPLIYLHHRPFSAEFYSRNTALLASDATELVQILDTQGDGSGFVALAEGMTGRNIRQQGKALDCIAGFRDTRLCRVTNADGREPRANRGRHAK